MKATLPPAEVRRVRELYGMGQREWADHLGLTGAYRARTVRKYESGTIPVKGPLKKLLELLAAQKGAC